MASLTSYQDTLGRKKMAHLLRRLTFGASKQEIDSFAQYIPQQAVEKLLERPTTEFPLLKDPVTGQNRLNPTPKDANSGNEALMLHIKCWWLDQMVKAPLSAVEKMSFFMHTHFTTMESRMLYAPALYYQIQLFREFSLGNFKTIAKKICMDHAMLRFLDGYLNEVGKPNENFAREFLELYTIGKGPQVGPTDYTNYTEDDIIAASKIFSGFKEDKEFSNYDPETVLAQVIVQTHNAGLAIRHVATVKQYSHAFENQSISPTEVINVKATPETAIDEIDQFVKMIYTQEASVPHICRKHYRYFVYYEITDEVEQKLILALAQELKDSNYELKPVLTTLFTSQHFYELDNQEKEDNNKGGSIKSSLDLEAGVRIMALQHLCSYLEIM